jgi:hypothetical protein
MQSAAAQAEFGRQIYLVVVQKLTSLLPPTTTNLPFRPVRGICVRANYALLSLLQKFPAVVLSDNLIAFGENTPCSK